MSNNAMFRFDATKLSHIFKVKYDNGSLKGYRIRVKPNRLSCIVIYDWNQISRTDQLTITLILKQLDFHREAQIHNTDET